jgi:hypothetical protein
MSDRVEVHFHRDEPDQPWRMIRGATFPGAAGRRLSHPRRELRSELMLRADFERRADEDRRTEEEAARQGRLARRATKDDSKPASEPTAPATPPAPIVQKPQRQPRLPWGVLASIVAILTLALLGGWIFGLTIPAIIACVVAIVVLAILDQSRSGSGHLR